MTRGYVGIGVYRSKTEVNIGTLFRSARAFDASFVYTIGRRWRREKSAVSCERHLPVFHFEDADAWRAAMPDNTTLVCIEITEKATPIEEYLHPERAVYLLGPEDGTLGPEFTSGCDVVSIPTRYCLNVATAGSIVLYDRVAKYRAGLRRPRVA